MSLEQVKQHEMKINYPYKIRKMKMDLKKYSYMYACVYVKAEKYSPVCMTSALMAAFKPPC